MSKKIIFVGPPGAGKTTLRKIFFEGESRAKLLEYALEPTHGQESILLKLSEDIGVFDLAGQENQRWFETEEKSIFYETKIFIVVIDITTPVKDIIEFGEKIINIRDELTPSSFIYLMLHKKDLITQDKLNDIKLVLIKKLGRKNLIKISFTSITKKFFLDTLSVFVEILKTCTSKLIENESIDFNILKNAIDLLFHIQQNVVISKDDLIKKLSFSDQSLDQIIKLLVKKNHINISRIHELPVFSLTQSGKKFFEVVLSDFALEKFKFESNFIESISTKKDIPPFIGFMIADRNGKTLTTTEAYDGVFDEIFQSENSEMPCDIELIPMFINALEKFSAEINIQNLSGFKLKGTNIKMQTFRLDLITITVFMSSDTNVKAYKDEIIAWFNHIFEINEREFEKSILTGDVSWFAEFNAKGREWLNLLNQNYTNNAINIDIFDYRQATNLYQKLDNIFHNYQIKSSVNLQKIKKLRNNLMYAFYNEDFGEIREIAEKVSSLNV